MIKRAALARALALDPALLMLDEPTAGLDPISAAAFDELLMDLRQQLGLTVIMITHDLDTIFRTCNRVGVIIDRKMTSDTLEGITGNPHPWIQAYFHGERALRFGQGKTAVMEREANYTAVGAFVLLIVTMAGLFVYWYAGSSDARDYRRYEIYFEGSVSGLESRQHGALPRRRRGPRGEHQDRQARRGPRAGHRRHRFADADLREHAGIAVAAGRDRPAVHRPAGQRGRRSAGMASGAERTISGHRFGAVELRPAAREPSGSRRPRHGVVDRASRVLSDDNITAFAKTMQNIEQTSATLPGAMRDAAVVVADLKATLVDVRAAAAGARQLMDTSGPDLAAASERIRTISENLANTTANLDRLMTDHREDLGLFLRDSLPEIERLLRDSRSAAQEFARVVAQPEGRSVAAAVRAELQGRGDSAMKLRGAGCSSRSARAHRAAAACSTASWRRRRHTCCACHRRPRPSRVTDRRQRACAAARGESRPRIRAHRAAAQRAALRFLRRQPLGGARARSRRERDRRHAARAPARSRRCSTTRRRSRRVTDLRCTLRRFEADYTKAAALPRSSWRSTARSAAIAIASCWRVSPRRARRQPAKIG